MSVPILRVCPQLPAVIAFGNPLLDIIVRMKGLEAVHGAHLLNKYNLKIDGQSELSSDDMHALLDHLPQELVNEFPGRHFVLAPLFSVRRVKKVSKKSSSGGPERRCELNAFKVNLMPFSPI